MVNKFFHILTLYRHSLVLLVRAVLGAGVVTLCVCVPLMKQVGLFVQLSCSNPPRKTLNGKPAGLMLQAGPHIGRGSHSACVAQSVSRGRGFISMGEYINQADLLVG